MKTLNKALQITRPQRAEEPESRTLKTKKNQRISLQINPFGHPSPDTLARLSAHGVQTFVTAKSGAITFVSDGRTVTAKPFLP